ncbi:hypothetical protein Tco_0838433 [Tanacetum coccineum]|uniref:Uncharacterized protein n=1 Tax=Tanacetum coccineum TaxID=301880 RepID=A0ABQ5ANS9_9ASTR
MRYHRLKTKNGNVGVKNGVFTPGGEKKRRFHRIGEIRKKNSDNICEGKIMAILKGYEEGSGSTRVVRRLVDRDILQLATVVHALG